MATEIYISFSAIFEEFLSENLQ